MQEFNMHEGWWKWGHPGKRKSLTDYPKFKSVLEKLWDTNLDKKIKINQPEIISNEEASQFCYNVFSDAAPLINISIDKKERLLKSKGKSFTELINSARGDEIKVADAVLYPTSHEEVVKIMEIASANKIILYPFAGGTNVVGSFKINTSSQRPVIAVNLAAMNKLINIDTENSFAVFETGILGPALENILNQQGFTMGHFPQSFEFSTLGGWIATHSAGQESSTYGRIEDMVIAIKVATPIGTLEAGYYESEAEGANIRSLFMGSEGMLGIITETKIKIHRLPEKKIWLSFLFPAFKVGLKALQQLIQQGILPAIIRYSDENETYYLSLLSQSKKTIISKIKSEFLKRILKGRDIQKPCLMIIRLDGNIPECNSTANVIKKMMLGNGAFYAGSSPGIKWEANRFGLPYLQDDMLERKIFIDTVETVISWSKIESLRKEVYAALQLCSAFNYDKGILISHVSHVYKTAASIYFTIITKQDDNPYRQWQKIKDTVMEITQQHGAAVSHHHSIGTDLQKWYLNKADTITKQILKSVKQTIDPNNILNPGKLFDGKE